MNKAQDINYSNNNNYSSPGLSEEVILEGQKDRTIRHFDFYITDFRIWGHRLYTYYQIAGRELSDDEKEEQALIYKTQLAKARDLYHQITDPVLRDKVIYQLKEDIEKTVKNGGDTRKIRQALLEIDQFFKNLSSTTNTGGRFAEGKEITQPEFTKKEELVYPPGISKSLYTYYDQVYHKIKDLQNHGVSMDEVNTAFTAFKSTISALTSNGPSKMMALGSAVGILLIVLFVVPFMGGEYLNAKWVINTVAGVEPYKASIMALLVFGVAHVFADIFFGPRLIKALRNNEDVNTHIPLIKTFIICLVVFAASLGAASYSTMHAKALREITEDIALEDALTIDDGAMTLNELENTQSPIYEPKLPRHLVSIEKWDDRASFFSFLYILLYGAIALVGSAYLWAMLLIHIKVLHARYNANRAEKKLAISHATLRESVSRLDQMKTIFIEMKALEDVLAYRKSLYGRENLN